MIFCQSFLDITPMKQYKDDIFNVSSHHFNRGNKRQGIYILQCPNFFGIRVIVYGKQPRGTSDKRATDNFLLEKKRSIEFGQESLNKPTLKKQ